MKKADDNNDNNDNDDDDNDDNDDDDNDSHPDWIIVRDGMYSVADKEYKIDLT